MNHGDYTGQENMNIENLPLPMQENLVNTPPPKGGGF